MAGSAKGRTAFMDLSPAGHRIRMMEPGEAEALRALAAGAGLFAAEPPEGPGFVRWLLRHEVFVAEDEAARISGFAAARDATDLYWLSAIAVDASAKGTGLRKALLAAVVARAGWFFHRAVGLGALEGEAADWYRRRRFLAVAPGDRTAALDDLLADCVGFDPAAEGGPRRDDRLGAERTVMLHWL